MKKLRSFFNVILTAIGIGIILFGIKMFLNSPTLMENNQPSFGNMVVSGILMFIGISITFRAMEITDFFFKLSYRLFSRERH